MTSEATMERLMDLRRRLERCWSEETASPDYPIGPQPSSGQCYVTALVVQDLFGGSLMRAVMHEETARRLLEITHFWNRLPDGTEIDLTADQFEDERVPYPVTGGSPTTTGAKRSNSRYKLLKKRLESIG